MKNIFPENILTSCLDGAVLTGLTHDALCLFVIEINKRLRAPIILSLETYDFSYMIYESFLPFRDVPVFFYPEKDKSEMVPGFISHRDRYRQETLFSLVAKKNPVVVTTSRALEYKDMPATSLMANDPIYIKLGEKQDMDTAIKKLVDFGYKRVDTVNDPGSYCRKGDLIDIYPPHFVFPVRCSFNFDTVDRISYFDPATQLSTKNIKITTIRGLVNNAHSNDNIGLTEHVLGSVVFWASSREDGFSIFQKNNTGQAVDAGTSEIVFLKTTKRERLAELQTLLKTNDGCRVFISGERGVADAVKKRIGINYTEINPPINRGFYSSVLRFFVVSVGDLLKEKKHIQKWSPPQKKEQRPLTLQSLTGLERGDFLVHKRFGIGIYQGLATQNQPGGSRETIRLEYNDNAVIFVSIENMGLLHRHLGTSSKPVVSSLGSKTWGQELRKARKAVRVVAKELIELYAKKQNPRPFSYSADKELESALASSFPFTETPDQREAINDVLSDMLKPSPMDRLVCGDVGFGKTEVALRAIMRAVISKKTCMFLCPTTILADQHYITCKERLEPLGVYVALLSRFKTRKEQLDILKKASAGKVDLLIGTHRLLSPDVIISSLGLLIVDEEHRFGVRHKEKIRGIKAHLDVITLSATPIPRTLQQSTVGLRDITRIQTPPASRKPINTEVRYFDWALINGYIKRELQHGGQVYFVHNDIRSLSFLADTVSKTFPRAAVGYIHGQLPSRELEQKVLSFFEGGIDILVCTSIIESGLDVSNSNCMIINGAHNFGLSQLYQMRGRVGRGGRQANCLLLVPKKRLDQRSYRRLKTIEQYTSLGSGYDISMKDLEIRGAGSLFGYKQSGHISAVGFEMYCELLKDEINTALEKNDQQRQADVVLNVDALIPDHYIKNPSQRLGFYDHLSKDISVEEIEKIKTELHDRFGRLPQETKNLISLARVRALFKNKSIRKIEMSSDSATFEFDDIKPFDSIEALITHIADWAVLNNFLFSFGKTKTENMLFTIRYKNFDSGVLAVRVFAKLF